MKRMKNKKIEKGNLDKEILNRLLNITERKEKNNRIVKED